MRKLLPLLITLCLLCPLCALAEEGLRFSHESGFYDGPIEVEILCDDPDADIYYTTDGTVPNEDSYYYDGAMPLEDRTREPNDLSAQEGLSRTEYIPKENVVKAHVLRAWAVYPNGEESPVISATYFVDVDREARYGDVPVISLMMDREDLFDYDTGIYALGADFVAWDAQQTAPYEDWETKGNYSNKGSDWERPVTVQYLAADGSVGFTQDMGVRIKGAVSRYFAQKSLRLIARSEYGEKQLKFPVFPDNQRADGTGIVEKYKSITLRNGGNDVEFTRLRDPFFQKLASGLGFMTQASEPCVVFINGEYWGMYNLTEEYSDHAIENNFGVENKNVILIKNGRLEDGVESDMEIYEAMFDFIASGDMTDPAVYQQACQLLDVPTFAQYCAFNLYIHNDDGIFQNNNWMIWRARETSGDPYCDGQWRFLLFDTENSSDIFSDGSHFGLDNISDVLMDDGASHEDRHPQKLFYSLYQNEDFQREFLLALCDIRNVNFRYPYAGEVLKEMRPTYELLMRETFQRFGPEWVVLWNLDTHHAQKLKQLDRYMQGRYSRWPWTIEKAMGWGMEDRANCSIPAIDPALGKVIINRTALPENEAFTGVYYPRYPITLTAQPAEGHTFLRWEAEGATLSDPASPTVTVTFEGDFTITPVFE